MMINLAFIAAFLSLAAGQPGLQQYLQNQYFNRPSVWYQQPEGPQNEGPRNYYQGPANGQYRNPFSQYQVISLVNSQNQPLGYVYSVESDTARQQARNLLSLRDSYGNLVGYYSLNQYKEGQEFSNEPLTEDRVSQLRVFGFSYVRPNQEKTGFIVVRNPNVFNFQENGVLRPELVPNNFFDQEYSYGQYPPRYGSGYGQQYQGPYNYQYQGPYNYRYQGPYNYQYQGEYPGQYQGSYPYQYQGSYPYQYQGSYPYQYQGSYPYQYQGSYPYQYQRPYAGQYQGPFSRFLSNYNQQYVAAN